MPSAGFGNHPCPVISINYQMVLLCHGRGRQLEWSLLFLQFHHVETCWDTRYKPVLQVLHLRAPSLDVSDCNTVSCWFSYVVRNKEAGGSHPLSSTIFSTPLLEPCEIGQVHAKRVATILAVSKSAVSRQNSKCV